MQTKASSPTTDVRAAVSDPERLRVLGLTGLMGPDAAGHVGRWADVAAQALDAAGGFVSLVGDDRQVHRSVAGAGGVDEVRTLPLAGSLCQHVVAAGRPLAVADAESHPLLRGNAVVAELDIGAYAGAPIVVSGQALGALCVTEPAPRSWSDEEVALLASLAAGLAHEIELRLVVAQLTRSTKLVEARSRIGDLIADDQPLRSVLDAIVACVESHDPDLYGSVLLLDAEHQSLRDGAGPSLPASYRAAIDGVGIGPAIGSCGAAAFSGEEVISSDLRTDESWSAFRQLVEPLGLRHCWSFPFSRSDGRVLGTLAVYGSQPRTPSEDERRFLRDTAKLAGIAIERRESRDRLVYDATHDTLTELVNRTVAFDRLGEMLAREVGELAGSVSVMLVGLDRLKGVNDSLGRETGDQIVRHAAERLRRCAAHGDLIARLDGSVCLVVSVGGHDRAAELAARILSAQAEPVPGLPGAHDLTVTASIGIAVVADAGTDGRLAVRQASDAMCAAEARGGNTYEWSDDSDASAASRRLLIETALRHATERDELSVVYQPLRSLHTGVVGVVEALVRWRHPVLGQVAPDEFIPIAEQSGLIHELGAWILRTACASLPALCGEYGDELILSVNVSAQQLRHERLPALVAGTLATNGLPADRLWLEITETALLGFDTTTAETVAALHAMGVHIVLDDFGTGYSSLAVLKRHPVDAIKIDRSFVDGVPGDHDDVAIVTALAAMGASLGLAVVAEGVESQSQHDALQALGCDYAQGFLVGRPSALLAAPPSLDAPKSLRSTSPDH